MRRTIAKGRNATLAIIHERLGNPEFARRIPADPALVIERHQAVIEVLQIPPLPAPVLFVHTGGKAFSYRVSADDTYRQSLPGLVTVVPPGIRARVMVGGIGAGTLVCFEDDRNVPRWLAAWQAREPLTFVDNLVVALTQQMASAHNVAGGEPEYLAVLGAALLAHLRHTLTAGGTGPVLRSSRSGLLLTHRAVQFMHEHLDAPLSVAEVAQHIGVGVTHFSQTFKAATGVTPHRYLLRARIERGSELLRMTSLSVGEIAAGVGFAGQSHFCTAFAKLMGMSPSRYRSHCRG
jgi:AraC family transcriptional regulator